MAEAIRPEMVGVKQPCFYEVFSSELSSDRLKMPVKFTGHMEARTSESVSLTGPSGKTWQVDLIKKEDALFFHDGWPTFVRDHCIDCGDLLVFRYGGKLHFTVQIFDPSGCEKEVAFDAVCSQDLSNLDEIVGQKRDREEVRGSSDDIEGAQKKIRGSSSQVNSQYIKRNLDADRDTSDSVPFGKEEVIFTKKRHGTNSAKGTKHCGSPSMHSRTPSQLKACMEEPEAVIPYRHCKEDYASSLAKGYMSKVLCEEKKVAQSFMSCFPYFVRIMKKFNISGSYTLKIPYDFSTTHLPESKIKIVLCNLKGECWNVNSVPTTRVHTSHTLCGGWMAFVRSNGINIGDICIFELVRKEELRVHIIGKERPDGENKKGSKALNLGCDAILHKTVKGLPKKLRGESSKVHSKCIKKASLSNKKESKAHKGISSSSDEIKHGKASKSPCATPSCLPKAGNEKLEITCNRTSIEDELGLQSRSLAMVSTVEEDATPSFVVSDYPHFVRIMKKFNISGSYTLKIPCQFSLAHLPNCKTEIILHNLKGERWIVNSVPDSKGRMAHTFCGGWTAFVRDNDVKMGDLCIFELVGKCEMRVFISGVGKRGIDLQNEKSTPKELPISSSTANCLSV